LKKALKAGAERVPGSLMCRHEVTADAVREAVATVEHMFTEIIGFRPPSGFDADVARYCTCLAVPDVLEAIREMLEYQKKTFPGRDMNLGWWRTQATKFMTDNKAYKKAIIEGRDVFHAIEDKKIRRIEEALADDTYYVADSYHLVVVDMLRTVQHLFEAKSWTPSRIRELLVDRGGHLFANSLHNLDKILPMLRQRFAARCGQEYCDGCVRNSRTTPIECSHILHTSGINVRIVEDIIQRAQEIAAARLPEPPAPSVTLLPP
jgi:hypothetical protein